jgi:hypothetical protein
LQKVEQAETFGVVLDNGASMRSQFLLSCVTAMFAANAYSTGLATCDSGPKSGWQPVEKLEAQLKAKGFTVRRIKEDGGCYEVYAFNEKGERGEYYFHPVMLEPVPIKPR